MHVANMCNREGYIYTFPLLRPLQGNTDATRARQFERVVLYPGGWGAGQGLMRPHDVVIMHQLVHACLQAAADAVYRMA